MLPPARRDIAVRAYQVGRAGTRIVALAGEAVTALTAMLRTEERLSALQALSRLGPTARPAIPTLQELLKDPDATGSVARALLDQIKSVQRDLTDAAKKVK